MLKNISNNKKIVLGFGALVVVYYVWNMWKSHEITEKNKKTVSEAIANKATSVQA